MNDDRMDDNDDFLTKEDCLVEIVYGDGERHEEAMARFIELGGTGEEMGAAFEKTIRAIEGVLKQGTH
jgi:hypothetical protein